MNEAEHLKSLADHFAPRDWEYTRATKIKHIRYEGDYSGYDHPWKRVKRVIKNLFARDSRWYGDLMGEPKRWWHPAQSWFIRKVAMTRVYLRTEKNLPDGEVLGAGLIAFWEEDGEYVQMVQPSVGSMLADFLIADPEHPHAVRIRTELRRLMDNYDARIKAGGVA